MSLCPSIFTAEIKSTDESCIKFQFAKCGEDILCQLDTSNKHVTKLLKNEKLRPYFSKVIDPILKNQKTTLAKLKIDGFNQNYFSDTRFNDYFQNDTETSAIYSICHCDRLSEFHGSDHLDRMNRREDGKAKKVAKHLVSVAKLLKSRRKPLKTDELYLGLISQDQYSMISSHIDLKSVKKLNVSDHLYLETDKSEQYEEFLDLNGLENVESLMIDGYRLKAPIQAFNSTIRHITIDVKYIDIVAVMTIKKIIMNSTSLENYTVFLEVMISREDIYARLGQPSEIYEH